MHERGIGQREIARFLGIPLTTVHDDIRRFEETGSYEDRKGRGRKKTARSKRNIQRAKGIIKRNPTTKATSAEEGLERNHSGHSGQDHRRLSEALEGLRRCQGWPF